MALVYGPTSPAEIDPIEVIKEAFADQAKFGAGDIRVERLRVRRDPLALAWRWSLTATAPRVNQRDVVRLAVRRAAGRWCVTGRREWPAIANGIVLNDPDRGWVVVADADGESNAVLVGHALDHLEMITGGGATPRRRR